MTNKQEIKETILKTAGNPETGVVVQFADEWADAIVKLISGEAETTSGGRADNNSQSSLTKETRVVGVAEKR
jgi:hypothetical protein